jgi:GntR family trehalose operon transcriptional repressor
MPKAMFQDIYRDLKDKIQSGVYKYQTFLPSEAELIQVYSCSRNTVRRALQMLADDAYVQPLHGKGVRVIWQHSRQTQGSLDGVESFEEYARNNGMTPSTSVKAFEHVVCNSQLSEVTGFDEGDDLTHIVRVRSLNGVARQIDHNYFLTSAVPDLTPEIASDSIYRHLEDDLAMRILTIKRSISVGLANDEDITYLDLWPYNCVAVVENQAFNSNGIMFEYTQTRNHPLSFYYRLISRR